MPNLITFTPNTVAESSEVNQNFNDVNNVLLPTFIIPITGALTVDTDLTPQVIVSQSMTIEKIYARVKTAPVGADLIIDINKNGSTIWSTQSNRITITAGNSSATQTSINTTSLAEGDYLTLDIDQVGSSTSGSDLTVAIKCSL